MVLMYVASRLKKFPHEVAEMPVEDLEDLLAFWRVHARRDKEG